MSPKLIRQMLAAQALAALTVSVCLLIDNIMINRFLGINAVAAYELSNPLLLSIGAVSGMLSAGIQVACSKSLGSGSNEETDRGYSTAIVIAVAVSVVFMLGVLIFRRPLAHFVGAGDSGEVYDNTVDYLAGFTIGAPGSMIALVLVPFLMMSGRTGLLVAAVSGMTVTDVLFDFLNVLVFKGGMFGMGLASSLSYYTAVLIGITYFVSKKCVFHFSPRLFSFSKAAELFRGGIPSAVNMASSIILVFFLNRLFMDTGGAAAVAAYAVVSGIANSANCISTGVNGVALTLSGILYQEDDRRGLKETLLILIRYGIIMGLGMGIVLLIFAPVLVRLFITTPGETQSMAILGVRLFAAGLIPCCVLNAFKSFFQGTERVLLTEAVSFLEGAVFSCLGALLMRAVFGLNGIWLNFFIGEMLALLFVLVYTRLRSRGAPDRTYSLLMLDDSFGVDEKDLMENAITSLRDAASVSEAAGNFCVEHGQSAQFANRIAVCIEEMATNTVTYGFSPGGKNRLSVRVQHKKDKWVLRFRDDCSAFDPVSYIPPEGSGKGVGIRLAMAMADEIHYTYSLNLNNLTLVFDSAGDDRHK